MELSKEDWKDEHLNRKHDTNYDWCPLCIARKNGEENPPLHLTPPQQDPTQKEMDYLKGDYKPDDQKYYGNMIEKDT